jgi:hypothetical protein
MAKTKDFEKHSTSTEKKSTPAKVNLTIKIDKDLLRKIRILAAEKGTSISAMVTDAFDQQSTQSGNYEASKRRAIALMNEPLGGVWERGYTRDELHERR